LEEVGRAARLDVLRVEAALAEARARETQAVAETRVARSSLARWMGRTSEQIEGVTLAAPTGVPSMPEEPPRLRRDAVERNLMLRDLRAAVDASQAQVGAARGSRLPQLALAGSIYEQGSVDGDFVTEWNVGVRVSLPVFTGGALGSTVERAEASHRGAVATLQASELRVAEQVDRGLAELESALSQSESLAVAVARAEEVVRIERLRVENEQATQSDYLDAEASLLMARAGLARARYGAWISRIRLDRTLGRLEHAAMVLDFGGER
jgi:outer membrane protein TolC